MEECTDFSKLRAVEIFKLYNDKCPYREGSSVNELQSNYDRCTEVLETVTMREIDLLWKLRRLPYFFDTMIDKFVEENYDWWKRNENFKKMSNLIRFGSQTDEK